MHHSLSSDREQQSKKNDGQSCSSGSLVSSGEEQQPRYVRMIAAVVNTQYKS